MRGLGVVLALAGSVSATGLATSAATGSSGPLAAWSSTGWMPPDQPATDGRAERPGRDAAAGRASRGGVRARVPSGRDGLPQAAGQTLAAQLAALNRDRVNDGQALALDEDHLIGRAKSIAARRAGELAAAAHRRARAAAARAAAARAQDRPDWVAPVRGARLSAGFGQAGARWSADHTGQDFAAPSGTPVRAAAGGVVVAAGWDGRYGLMIRVAHPDGTQSWYAHLSEIVRSGGTVRAGELIGRVGSTGNTTGPHLHLEIHPQGGPAVDPLDWLAAHGVVLTA